MSLLYGRFDFVTSLVDYYGFHGKRDRTVEELEGFLKEQVLNWLSRHRDSRKVLPYVQQHEFESLLFSDVTAFGKLPDAPTGLQDSLHEIRSQFRTPEDIDDHPRTAPSKRISRLMPGYRKVANAAGLMAEMGLGVIRAECPRFDDRMTRLETLETAAVRRTSVRFVVPTARPLRNSRACCPHPAAVC